LAAEGEFALVKEYMEKALTLPGQPVRRGTIAHGHIMYATLADVAAQQRDLPALEQYAPVAEELAARDGHKLYLAIARRAQGVAARLHGEETTALALLRQAVNGFQQIGARWQTGRTLLELGELALAVSNPQAAREHFSQALELFEALGAAPDAARTRTALAALN
jgi:hypothetical protein